VFPPGGAYRIREEFQGRGVVGNLGVVTAGRAERAGGAAWVLAFLFGALRYFGKPHESPGGLRFDRSGGTIHVVDHRADRRPGMGDRLAFWLRWGVRYGYGQGVTRVSTRNC
jgi:hypothetical protein